MLKKEKTFWRVASTQYYVRESKRRSKGVATTLLETWRVAWIRVECEKTEEEILDRRVTHGTMLESWRTSLEYSIDDGKCLKDFQSWLILRAWHVRRYKSSRPWHVASQMLKRRSKNVASWRYCRKLTRRSSSYGSVMLDTWNEKKILERSLDDVSKSNRRS